MKVYDAASIRNVALVGHSGSGKTQLVSAILFDAGAVNRFGKVDEGTTVTDLRRRRNRPQAHALGQPRLRRVEQDQDQHHRHAGHGQLPRATRARRCASPTRPSSSSTRSPASRCRPRKSGQAAEELGLPRLVVVNRLDRERASLERTLESLRDAAAATVIPDPAADRRGERLHAASSTWSRRRRSRSPTDGSGKITEGAVPAEHGRAPRTPRAKR